MRLLDFLRREATVSWRSVIIMTVISGIANGCILALINAGASAASSDELSLQLLILFMVSIAVFVITKNYALDRTMHRVERMVRVLRVRIVDKIRRTELPFMETLGHGQLYTTIAQDANIISQSAFISANAAQQGIMLVFALLYVAWLSPFAFVIILAAIAAGTVFYHFHRKSLKGELRALTEKDVEFADSLEHIVDGFKEAKLNRRKNDALFDSFDRIAADGEALKVGMASKFVTDVMFSHVFFYVLIGIVVFLLPRVVSEFSQVVLKMTAAILFIVAPLELIVNAMPLFTRANVALDEMYSLEHRLDQHLDTVFVPRDQEQRIEDFHEIVLDGAVYSYENRDEGHGRFTIGPLHLKIPRGEMLFIVGGNGSGKSTLLKVLCGLYPLTSGTFRVDNLLLGGPNISAYRELISAIFADFHLFDRLYGLEGVDELRVRELLKETELDRKTSFSNGHFTNLRLSTGQRKRLALVVSLLENREIYVFDEWASDQDAHYREYFYRTILPRLKSERKTVIAVTHDDRYWNLADRTVKMETGMIVGEWSQAPADERADR